MQGGEFYPSTAGPPPQLPPPVVSGADREASAEGARILSPSSSQAEHFENHETQQQQEHEQEEWVISRTKEGNVFYTDSVSGRTQWETPFATGDSPLHGAVSYNYRSDEHIAALLRSGNDPNVCCCHRLVVRSNEHLNPALTLYFSSPQARNFYGMTPLHHAAQSAFVGGVRALMLAGASPVVPDVRLLRVRQPCVTVLILTCSNDTYSLRTVTEVGADSSPRCHKKCARP